MASKGQPGNYALVWRSAEGRLSVRGLPPRVHLDRVYTNGLHALVPFWIANESDQDVTVELTTEGPLKVQQQNANWSAVSAAQRETYVDVTTAPAGKDEVTMVCSATIQREFSEVFNQLGGVSSIRLAAQATAELVLLFVAEAAETDSGDGQRYEYETHGGHVTLRAGTDSYDVALRASTCRSVLEMEPPTSRIYVDDCVIGRTYERTLRVRNASAIGLDWTMTVVETTDPSLSALQLLDSDMRSLSGGHLGARSDTQVLVRYTPHAAGEFLSRFLVENSNDPASLRYWVFRARVSQRQKPRRVELLSDPDISFGDCTSGVWYSRDIRFKNVSDTPVVMRLRVEGNTAGLTMKSAVRADGASAPEPNTADADTPIPTLSELISSRRPSIVDDNPSDALTATDDVGSEGGSAELSSRVTPADDSTPAGDGVRAGESGRRFVARARAARGHKAALFDEMLIKPGAVRTMTLSLLGNPVSSTSVSAGQFERQSFTLFGESSTAVGTQPTAAPPPGTASNSERNAERLSIPCTANMCTPFVRVVPPLLDFGSVDVGTLKSLYLRVENLSQVAATVQCKLESKVITCTRAPITIAPQQSVSVRVDSYPRRVNARYRKQIIVRNIHNRLNDSVVEVRSTHVDRRRVAFHNLFYQTLVPANEQNFVDFGLVPLNARSLRRVNLRNVCRCPLAIEVAADAADAGAFSAYTVVPQRDATGRLTDAACQVARRLPLLERQAAMHSNIEKFKERTAGATAPESATLPPRSSLCPVAVAPVPRAAGLTLQPDMFIDKSVEQGHVCLMPFSRPRNRTVLPPSLEYLDIAPATAKRRNVVRIRGNGNSDIMAAVPPESALLSSETPSNLDILPAEEDVEMIVSVIERAEQILDEIIERLDMIPQTLFASPEAENAYVRRQVDLHKYIDLLVESGFLQPAHHVRLTALGTESLIVILQPAGTPDKPAPLRFDANLYFKLVDRPGDLLPFTDCAAVVSFASADQLPVRRFLVQAALVQSELELGQKSINVGNMQVDEACRKYLVIQNRSETPLMYAIRKTGSIASGDICFVDSRYGIVRGFDSRKVVFVFSPSLHGAYSEQISIANVLNARGGKKATLKAAVRRQSKFYIQSLRLEFGTLEPGRPSADVQVLAIKNMTPKTRHLIVKSLLASDDGLSDVGVVLEARFPPDIAAAQPARLLDRETEEKIESLEQKLKIAVRKNRPEKVEKYQAKLAKLRGSGSGGNGNGDNIQAADAVPDPTGVQIRRLVDDTQLEVELPPGGDVSIPVVVTAKLAGPKADINAGANALGTLVVHEVKDKDNVKLVTLAASVALDQ
ncbi:hypothetical protein GGF49_000591 [Coemansia sp. RSA 1853]|nr:hypothetical protein LPJ76_002781 [Coemansia sp. RSA 638]KAJ2545158.1 hypothetical protein GGF49_000591 [Coemansia sp. RSA 1853]